MLVNCGRVFARTTGLNGFGTLPAFKAVILSTTTRGLATASAPKKAATTTATKKTATSTATKAKAPAKKTTTATTKKAPAAAKPAAKKATGKTAASKSTNVEAKPKSKARVPKTDEQKQKEHIKALLEKALDPPSIRAVASPWIAFTREKWASVKGSGDNVVKSMQEHSAEWVREYKSLTPAQIEAYAAQEGNRKEDKEKARLEWVYSHTPAQINSANAARKALRRIKKAAKENNEPAPQGLKTKTFPAIPDPRFPLKPRSAHLFYVTEKMAGLPADQKVEAMITGMKEFKTLPEAEQKKYQAKAAADRERYRNALRAIGIEPTAASESD